ncbi:MAG: hypothetical protein IJ093_01015 [Bacilli bacterium]|nr:hypothetical protein [Bacilli bacterium]
MFYYYYIDIWTNFFDYLKIPYIISPKTNEDIIKRGIKVSFDEMCYALKTYLGHVDYLKDKCDYILIPRIDNYKLDNQTCTNFLSAYDIVKNTFNCNILSYNINLDKNETLKKGLLKMGKKLKKTKSEISKAYKFAIDKYNEKQVSEISNNMNKLNSTKTKILIISHPYNIYDGLIGSSIIKYLENNDIAVIYSDKFDSKKMNKLSKEISKDLYFKYSKENIGSLIFSFDKIDGVIFLSAFPCGPDSLANELAFRKIDIPYINLIIDNNQTFTAVETRLESFIDILKGGLND